MFEKSARKIAQKCNGKEVIVVGAGKNGVELISYLINHEIVISEIFDNKEYISSKKLYGINISKPRKINADNVLYIVTPESPIRESLVEQLFELNVRKEEIAIYYSSWTSGYLQSVEEDDYQEEISDMFREKHGYDMNWQSPTTYNEIINWEKINIQDERRTKLADKYLAKEWVKEKIGDKYIAKTYYTWNDVESMDFSVLPKMFVLKVNNGSSRNIIVKDKAKLDVAYAKKTLATWMKQNFAYICLEMHYKDIVPRIICEEYLSEFESGAVDFKIYCFHGKAKYIQRIKNEHLPNACALVYDTQWKVQEFNHGYVNDSEVIEQPSFIDEMINLTEILCKDFEHVRVDWFVFPNGRFLFAEMSFSSWAGNVRFSPESYDDEFGKLICNKQ